MSSFQLKEHALNPKESFGIMMAGFVQACIMLRTAGVSDVAQVPLVLRMFIVY